ncbi:poly-beta-1,6 N-acetyl-D-glucosamine synthase [Clostridium polyendosporum]|uniref:Poly-beta-1,6-N-acetyl-D-glucosamine synthase n=1 Tax=Clostridium polyendosporum TaxID=69208 RepID=A0A919RYH2_9CLOT|nr:poly-beta-1,6-N-acetyl-D-glucosamine synthase [Clostridium polyendosporum]GIM27883.1 poly-beta-1,6 N-acetyl-D-glucosamine synthase [Clostridium polyendosporum]
MDNFTMYVSLFVFWYPLVMSTVWIIGGILFYHRREKKPGVPLTETPMVSILIPCYNEEDTIENTIEQLNELNYPNYEIITINDGSKDMTELILENLSKKYKKLRVIQLKTNTGKANALYLGLIASKGEFLVGLDADAYLDVDALSYMIPHFITPHYGERVGAVTGNPRVRNRSSLLARIQLCEFSSIISLIKRTQRLLGKVMTVSGVVVMFRKRALIDCGLWDRDLITEDIGVTWKLQKRFWDIRYEPRAICWMLVPETIVGLWKQRVRWAQGGLEVIMRHWDIFLDWRYRRLLPVYIEQIFSIFWAIAWSILFIITIIQIITGKQTFFPMFWQGQYLSLLCLVQFVVAMSLDKRYDEKLLKYYLWAIWYPIFYWYFNALVILRAIPKTLFRDKRKKFAIWDSPDRGISI